MLIMKLPYTEVKFYPELESQAGLSSLLMKGDKLSMIVANILILKKQLCEWSIWYLKYDAIYCISHYKSMWMCVHVVVSHSYLRLFDQLEIERVFAFKAKHQRTKLNSKEQSKTYLEYFSGVVLICHNFSFSFISLKSVFI